MPSHTPGLLSGPRLHGEAARWAVTEAAAMHEDGSSSNDVWLLGRGTGDGGGMQAKGLVGKVTGTVKARFCSEASQSHGQGTLTPM